MIQLSRAFRRRLHVFLSIVGIQFFSGTPHHSTHFLCDTQYLFEQKLRGPFALVLNSFFVVRQTVYFIYQLEQHFMDHLSKRSRPPGSSPFRPVSCGGRHTRNPSPAGPRMSTNHAKAITGRIKSMMIYLICSLCRGELSGNPRSPGTAVPGISVGRARRLSNSCSHIVKLRHYDPIADCLALYY